MTNISKFLASLSTKWRNLRIWGQTNEKHEGRGDTAIILKQKNRWEGNNNSWCDPFLTFILILLSQKRQGWMFYAQHPDRTKLLQQRSSYSVRSWTKPAVSHEQAHVRTTRAVIPAILKLLPDNTSRPPFAYFPLPLCAVAQMAAASSSLCSQMTLTQELNWPLFLGGCSLDTTCVCRRDNGERCRLQNPPPPIICALCVRACVRDRLPPN